ncbi:MULTISPECIES: sulfate ABC transporter permease subunit CysW [unclassified Leptolyngbya]|uniref:sulfate ABC transporter permease subunit CysW n=1 Tax=unclassified Leptolyngbya TaxID=2650499 RepID=UPI00168213AC|nr:MULTISPECIES: sulfate ABC transporter permease subunit CysW [unclassified Leptolyngbya]MBD1913115.1 sulfate ABC transporter permease subunit CysW [Leptolyngbya sp. FACHB-8]MBD2157811.1 sulfate ABC transporter permease subunit CysW [Leptolyngbya sp. FACHB-16]
MTIKLGLNTKAAATTAPGPHAKVQGKREWVKWALIASVAVYLTLVLFVPALNVFVQAFSGGLGGFFESLTDRKFLHAAKLTLIMAVVAVPLNTVFGLCAALAIAHKTFRGRTLLLSLIDLPFSISPVVAGLMIVLLYGRNGWFGPLLDANNIKIIFAVPGMVLASAFVTLPFVAREVLPALEDAGTDQEEAAKTLGANSWQVLWRVTLPSIRWSLLYGILLTNARAMGEFGAISVVSGNITGKTQTLPLFVEEAHVQYQSQAAYSAAVVLALLAVVTIILKEILERRTQIKEG